MNASVGSCFRPDLEGEAMNDAIKLWNKVKKEVKRIGGTIEGGKVGKWYRFNLCSPDGFIWDATGDTDTLVVEWKDGDDIYRMGSVSDAWDRVSMGLSENEE